ncbi:MAG: hypothetical protein HRT44_07315 [Bdellovibrionales bacterium]|nr:hypothetical protein [Bdellovibrionales bacterium]NQZ19046.1 hypothetical protein [Bdellovibrionales bacterium]
MRVCLIVLFFPLFTYGTSTCDPETVAGSSILLEACEVNNQLCSALVNNHRGRHVSMLHTRFASGEPRTDGRDIIRSNQMTYYNTQNSGPNYHTFLTTVRTINGIQGPAVNFDGTNYMSEFDIYRDKFKHGCT